MGWKEDLEAEIAAERETLRNAGVEQVTPPEQAEAQADAYLRDEPGDLETVGRSEAVMAEGRTLHEAGVTYEGEADLNDVIQTVEDEGAPEVPKATEPEPEPEPEGGASERDPFQPEELSNEEYEAYKQDMAEMEAARTPEEIDAEQQEMADYHDAEQARAGGMTDAEIDDAVAHDVAVLEEQWNTPEEPDPEIDAAVAHDMEILEAQWAENDSPEVTEPEAETVEVAEPEADAPEISEPEAEAPEAAEVEASETDDFEAWADSKAPTAPEQGQEIEQDAPEPEPEQMEIDFDEER